VGREWQIALWTGGGIVIISKRLIIAFEQLIGDLCWARRKH
jgi:hypothetical protein